MKEKAHAPKETQIGKVFLKNSQDRLKPYQMAVVGKELIISCHEQGIHVIKQDLKTFYLQTNDDPANKCTDTKRKNYCARLMFCNSNGHVKLYFATYESMIEVIGNTLQA